VDLLVAYSNRSDLREQLQQVAVILSAEAKQDDGPDPNADSEEVCSATRWWSLRDRFSPENLQTMIDLYRSGTTARQVAEKFGVSVRSVTRLLRKHGVRREHWHTSPVIKAGGVAHGGSADVDETWPVTPRAT
jgi:hypothetical protein